MLPVNAMRWERSTTVPTSHTAGRGMRRGRVYRLRHAGRLGFAVSEFSRTCLTRLMDYPDIPIHLQSAQIVKADATTLLLRTHLRLGSGRTTVAYKRIQRRTAVKILTSLLRPQRLLRSWRVGHHLRSQGVATPRPLAAITARRLAWRADGYLATQWIDGAVGVDVFLDKLGCRSALERQRISRAAATELGRLIAQMHEASVQHRDLKVANLLLSEQGQRIKAWVIDLEGASVALRVPWRTRYKNLARLTLCFRDELQISLSLRLRFCRAYLDACGAPRDAWKSLWNTLDRSSARLARKKRRRQRRSR